MSITDTLDTDATQGTREPGRGTGRVLRGVTGWSLLVGALGIFVDSWASWYLTVDQPQWLIDTVAPGGISQGSIGLIPAYLGVTIGSVGLVLVAARTAPRWVAAVVAAGVAGLMVFWFSYPDHATLGGLGTIVVGIGMLLLPGWSRLVTPLWVAAGVLGIPELVSPGVHWGVVAGFTLTGAAVLATGTYVLWGSPRKVTAGP